MTDRARAVLAPLVLILVTGCGGGASPASTTSPSPLGSPTAPVSSPSPSTPLAPSPSPRRSQPSAPSPTSEAPPSRPTPPSPTPPQTRPPAASPTAPTVEQFWASASAAVEASGRLRIRVIGPSPGVLRYQPDRSATVIDGEITFVCRDATAYDGQSGFEPLPGRWTCGTDALVRGFRMIGQPLDAWSPDLPSDDAIRESVSAGPAGTWTWTYQAVSPFVGGQVRTTVVLDPSSGQIRSASRTDPLGETTYGISYTEDFPQIAVP